MSGENRNKYIIRLVKRKMASVPVPVFCKTHKTEDVIFYCDDCEILVCRDCVKKDHKLHNLLKFNERVEESKVCLNKNIESVTNGRLQKLRENLQDVVSLKETKERENQDMMSDIISKAEKIIEMTNFIRENLMDRCESLHRKNEEAIEKKISQLDARIELFEKAEAFGKSALEHGNDAEIIHEDLELRRHLHHYQPINIFEDIDRPIFVDGDLSEITLMKMFGSVLSEIRQFPKEEDKRPRLKVKKVAMFVCGIDDIVGICPYSTEVAWLHPKKGSTNVMINVDGHQMSKVEFGFVVTSFAPSKNGIIYMSDYSVNRIFSMDASKNFTSEITLSLHPIGISVCANGDILICVTDEWIYSTTTKSQRKVIRMTKDFKEKQVFELDEQGENMFTLPIAVAENINSDICIIDKTGSNKGRVCVLLSSGKLHFIYNHASGDQPFDPSAVCCTKHSDIIVSDAGNNTVEIISKEGEFMYFLITEKGGCVLPLSLGKDPDDKIWIGCGSGKCIVLKYGYGLRR